MLAPSTFMAVSAVHPLNMAVSAYIWIDVTESGMLMVMSEVQPSNAPAPIVVRELLMVTDVSVVHPENADSQIDVTA